jgi:hypothetical protein
MSKAGTRTFVALRFDSEDEPTLYMLGCKSWLFVCPKCETRFAVRESQLKTKDEPAATKPTPGQEEKRSEAKLPSKRSKPKEEN